MSYGYYSHYYYNPEKERAIIKNENLVHLGERMKDSMCGIGQWRYILDGIEGKYTVLFDWKSEPSEFSLANYKRIPCQEARKVGNPKRDIPSYINTIDNIKKAQTA